jgi:hypothetical protein
MSMISYIKSLVQNRILVVITIIALFIGRKVNISFLLSGTRSNNYLDIVVDIRFMVLFVVSVLIGGYLVSKDWKKSSLVLGYLAIWEVVLIGRGFEQWFHGIERLVYGFLMVVFGWVIWREVILETRLRWVFLCGFVPFLMFDHFLLSESTGVFSLWILLVLIGNQGQIRIVLKTAIFTFLSFHLVVMMLEIMRGLSLGLGLFGESVLDVLMPGLATWEIVGHKVLRGYGLFSHPNITGFIGWIFLVAGFVWICNSLWVGRLLCGVGILQVLLSGSRMAVLSMIIVGSGVIMIQLPKKIAWLGSIISIGLFASYLIIRGFASDIYRFGDLEKWVVVVQSLQWQNILFGFGLGQYPFYLRDSLPFLEGWQYEPVHNGFLLLAAEMGISGVMFLLVIARFLGKKKNPFTSM